MSRTRTAYAWQQDGKWRLSSLPKKITNRPSNVYDTQPQLLEEAGRRGMQVEWEDNG